MTCFETMASSYTSSPRYINDTDYEDADSFDFDDDRYLDDKYTDEDFSKMKGMRGGKRYCLLCSNSAGKVLDDGTKITLHRIPSGESDEQQERRAKWLSQIKLVRPGAPTGSNTRVCNLHFESNVCFPDSVPTKLILNVEKRKYVPRKPIMCHTDLTNTVGPLMTFKTTDEHAESMTDVQYSTELFHGNDEETDDGDSKLSCHTDTEDASETDMAKQQTEYTEIKEQMYQDKLAHLKKQLQQLEEGTLPEYIKKKRKIDQQFKERNRINEIWREFEFEMVEREYIAEKKAAAYELEEKKVDLKEHLVCDYEDKKRNIDSEKHSMDLLSGFLLSDTMEVKPVTTRKLRRRPNDPIPLPEKRRKPSPDVNYFIDDSDIMDDLRIINKVSGKPISKKVNPPSSAMDAMSDVRIDDGRLYFDKKWFHRNQPVYVESKDGANFNGVITAIGTQEIWVRKIADNFKFRIYLSQLQKGRYILRRRSS